MTNGVSVKGERSRITNDAEMGSRGQKERADGIVHARMQHASTGNWQREATDINQLVADYIDLAYHGKRAQVSDLTVGVARDLGADVGEVDLVPQEIGRVLLNLLGNAFDAVHEHAAGTGGDYTPTVTVSTLQIDGQNIQRINADAGLVGVFSTRLLGVTLNETARMFWALDTRTVTRTPLTSHPSCPATESTSLKSSPPWS